jgi:hypothetical protein
MSLDIPPEKRPSRTRADVTRDLIDRAGLGPIEAHKAVTQGQAAEILGSQVVTPEMIGQ